MKNMLSCCMSVIDQASSALLRLSGKPDIMESIRKAGFSYALLLTFAGGLTLTGCAKNPATGESKINLISESQEISMGKEADKQISTSLGLYSDSNLQRYIQELGSEIAATSERPDLPWTFRVLDDPVVNAFALPGGYIYVTRGILAHLDNEAELAGVLGHEIGHVTAKHSVNRMSTQQLTQIGLIAGMIIEPGLQKYGQLASAGLGLLFLKYSRDDEKQADDLGLRYMRRAGNDPREMVGVFDMLENVSGGAKATGRVPEWLATHPDPSNRKERIQSQLDTLIGNLSNATVNRDSDLNRLDGMTYGQNPREGYFKINTFYHPDLRFTVQFPAGWQYANQKQGVLAVTPDQDGIIQVTLASQQSADAAAQEFFSQEGLSAERTSRGNVNGLPHVSGRFRAQTEQGELSGIASFIDYEGNVYQVLGYSPSDRWSRNEMAIGNAMQSFDRLTDPKALSVQPLKLDIVTLDLAMTVDQFASSFPTPVTTETLALINQVGEGQRLEAGKKVKRIVGEPTFSVNK
ncbi:MAG: M48 family metalloprotease [candidate division Zixibacteria bacterium]|nr:M48 family metalloprotease [candidate division Zixibacteria bacterium]